MGYLQLFKLLNHGVHSAHSIYESKGRIKIPWLCLQPFSSSALKILKKNNELTNYQGIPCTIVYLVQFINTYVLIQHLTYIQCLTLLTEPAFYSHILNRIYKCKRMLQWKISQSRVYNSFTKPKYFESKNSRINYTVI